jgi:hypothetical protein
MGKLEPVVGNDLAEILVKGQDFVLAELEGVPIVGVAKADNDEAARDCFIDVHVAVQVPIVARVCIAWKWHGPDIITPRGVAQP